MKRKLLLLFVLCLALVVPLRAQDNSAPIILLISGDLWSWDGSSSSLKQLTQEGYIRGINLSPDASKLAYIQYPSIVTDLIRGSDFQTTETLPEDIWIMDIASGSITQAAAQPSDAYFSLDLVRNQPDKFVVRSVPVWSPDGGRLAWTEYGPEDGVQHVTLYDPGTGESQVIVPVLPRQIVIDSYPPLPIIWLQAGIVVQSFSHSENFLVYDTTGRLITSIVDEQADMMLGWLPVTYNDQDYMAVHHSGGVWTLFDLHNGQSQPAPDTLSPYSPLALKAAAAVTIRLRNGQDPYFLQRLDAQGNPAGDLVAIGYNLWPIALSPDGQAFAYQSYDMQTRDYDTNLTIWRHGQSTVIPLQPNARLDAVVWGPRAWRMG